MLISVDDLDKLISDVEGIPTINKETYREFIRSSEKEFGLDEANIETFSDQKLTNYIRFLDDLWLK